MHPAFSIIFFTSISGIGYGLAFFLGLGSADLTTYAGRVGYAIALGMIGLGLISSTFHLGHPERAWRALSQWRSSWLSREGVVAVVALMPLGISGLGVVLLGEVWNLPLLIGAFMAVPVVYCTAMIYASIKTVHHWYSGLTPVCYLLFAVAGGAMANYAIGAAGGRTIEGTPWIAVLAIIAAWSAKIVWWRRADTTASASTPQSATGLGDFGLVNLLERPHSTANYLTNEMGHKVARKHAATLRRIALLIGAFFPILLILAVQLTNPSAGIEWVIPGFASAAASLVAFLAFIAGVMVERWLFFAEARHTVMLYYGEKAA